MRTKMGDANRSSSSWEPHQAIQHCSMALASQAVCGDDQLLAGIMNRVSLTVS